MVLEGKGSETIVVGAHFDKVPLGEGIVDNWTGAALLPSLMESLRKSARQHTFVFVSFADEEIGLRGSKAYVKESLGEKPLAMVNIDSLGLSSTKLWLSRADKNLAKYAFALADGMHLPLDAVNVDEVGNSDSEAFQKRKVPVVDFHSLTQETLQILHSAKDQMSAVNRQHYYESYKLLSAYLALLDQELKAPATQ